MTDPLDEIRARRAGVSSDPWHHIGDEVLSPDDLVVAEVSGVGNPEFIAHAPADIDALVGEVEQLRRYKVDDVAILTAEVERLRGLADEFLAALVMTVATVEAFFEDEGLACSSFTRDMLATAKTRIHDLLNPPKGDQP
jgi:hypothetical protein